MRKVLASLFVLLGTGSLIVFEAPQRGEPVADALVRAVPVALDPADPARVGLGALRYLGGWELRSDDPDFGGISAMVLVDGGFVAISDGGDLYRFAIDAAGMAGDASIARLPDGPEPEGGGEPQKRDRDSEALAFDARSGNFWIGFERANSIWRYDRDFEAAEANRAIPEMEDWPLNSGPEAMVRLSDGRFAVFSESGDGPADSSEALIFDADPAVSRTRPLRFGYRAPAGHRITDAALLPDGRLIALNRRFTLSAGPSIVVTILDLDGVEEDAIVEGRTIARLALPLTVDNFEALAVEEIGGRTIVWMASDDNFNPLQRTLLFKFELVETR